MVLQLARKISGTRVWFERSRKGNFRTYHLLAISRLVCAEGSMWKVVIGPVAIGLGFRPNLGERRGLSPANPTQPNSTRAPGTDS
jgi:hypothetical protein